MISTKTQVEDFPGSSALDFTAIKNNSYRQIAKELGAVVRDFWVDEPEEPSFCGIPDSMIDCLRYGLGVPSLYSHQGEAWDELNAGRSLVLQTPTASGKTYSFNPAILQSLVQTNATAAYLFPLKALCEDQLQTIERLNSSLIHPLKTGVMTGDTSKSERERIWNSRDMPQLVVWSPDVLHCFLYNAKKPEQWQQFREYLRNLRYVVVDEAHTYQGVFGSHFANLRRRLELLVDSNGGDSTQIQYVFATATVANGGEMIEKFSGRPSSEFAIIDKSGAGSKGRVTLCLSPQADQIQTATDIVSSWFNYGVTGIVFCNARSQCKRLVSRLREELGRVKGSQIEVYYGGMRQSERERVISGLRSGRTTVVISTSALEAGVDIPALDACLQLGFPGSIMSYRQGIGRAGRKSEGLVIFSPSDRSALDGFYASEPQRLLGEPERISFNPQYESILAGHLCCAAAECGIPVGDEDSRFGEGASALLRRLAKEGWEHDSFQGKKSKAYPKIFNGRWNCSGYPHMGVNIRGNASQTVSLVCEGDEIESMDLMTAIRDVPTGAIYTSSQDGVLKHYQSLALDTKELIAELEELPSDKLRTQTRHGLSVQLKTVQQSGVIQTPHGSLTLSFGLGSVSSYSSGYTLYSKESKLKCPAHGSKSIEEGVCTICGTQARLSEQEEAIGEESFEKPFYVSMSTPVLEVVLDSALLMHLKSEVQALKSRYQSEFKDCDPFSLPREILAAYDSDKVFLALHSFAHQLNLAFPTRVLGSQHDIDTYVDRPESQPFDDEEGGIESHAVGSLRLWIYDTTSGGSGATEMVFQEFQAFAKSALRFSQSCECSHGCPKCLSINRCSQRNQGLNKDAGQILSQIL